MTKKSKKGDKNYDDTIAEGGNNGGSGNNTYDNINNNGNDNVHRALFYDNDDMKGDIESRKETACP